MTNLIQSADFFDAPASPGWTLVSSSFTLDGVRVYPTQAATEAVAVLSAVDPSDLLSESTPRRIRYALSVTLPQVFPAGEIKVGVGALMRATNRDGLWLVFKRTAGGASSLLELLIRRPAGSSAADHSLFSSFAPASFAVPAAGETLDLRLDVTIYGGALLVEGFLNGASLFVSTPTVGLFNSITGRTLSSFDAATLFAGLVANAAGSPIYQTNPPGAPPPGGWPVVVVGTTAASRTYVDALRVTDWGALAALPSFFDPAPTLSPTPTLSTLSLAAEDEGTAATLPILPSYVLPIAEDWNPRSFEADGGWTSSVAGRSVDRKSWRFGWDALTRTDCDTLRTFVDDVAGGLSWSWTDANGTVYRASFASDPEFVLAGPNVWQATAQIEGVR